MRQETKKICQAFIDGKTARAARTHTDGEGLYLHGYEIAWFHHNDVDDIDRNILHVSFCGWPSSTTKERLNGLFDLLGFGRPFFTNKGTLYFGSKIRPVDSNEIMTFDLQLMRELTNDDALNYHTIAA